MPPQIFITSSGQIASNGKDKKSPLPVFRNNQIVEAKALRIISDQQAELLIAGRKILANTRVPFSPGEAVYLKNIESEGKQRFVLIDTPRPESTTKGGSVVSPAAAYNKFAQFMAGLPEHYQGKSPAQLYNFLVEIAEKGQLGDKGFLTMLISASGMVLEKKLFDWLVRGKNGQHLQTADFSETDIKAALLLLAGEQGGLQAAGEMLQPLERLQVFNKKAMDESGKLLLPLPYVFEGGVRFGELLIGLGGGRGKEKKKKGKDVLLNVALILELSVLGQLLADFSLFGKTISGRFTVTTPESRRLLIDSKQTLANTLEAQGFKLSRVEVQVTSKQQLSSMSLVDRVKIDEEDLLSIII